MVQLGLAYAAALTALQCVPGGIAAIRDAERAAAQ